MSVIHFLIIKPKIKGLIKVPPNLADLMSEYVKLEPCKGGETRIDQLFNHLVDGQYDMRYVEIVEDATGKVGSPFLVEYRQSIKKRAM